ncbi:putative T7SS-secreted protein [Saccharopolyspora cebuensis]|uniref:T7SS-secreted protein n=1 Tax=Saccharopolyspora cebuensis TaxID=418759 RepID=A0ABV4CM56_9PSEU
MAELGETSDPQELVPGSPQTLDANVRVLSRRAREAVDVAVALRAIDTGAWTGKAAEAFRASFDYEPTKWYDVGDALESAAQVLDVYAGTLRYAQSEAAEAIALWDKGQQQTRRALAAHEAAAAQSDQGLAGAPEVGPFSDPGEATRQAAQAMLQRARQQLAQVAGETTQALRGLTPPEAESTFSQIAHGALDLAGFIPGFGEVADLTNAAWYAAQGKGVEAGLSAAAAIPFVGWGAGAAKITKASGPAADAAKAAGHAPAQLGQAVRKDYRKTFFENHPELEGKVVVHHAVEQGAAKRYPDAELSLAEMHSYDNLRGIPKEENSALHLKAIRKEWDSFYRSHPEATKEQLLDFATHIDSKFGDRFNPPVR